MTSMLTITPGTGNQILNCLDLRLAELDGNSQTITQAVLMNRASDNRIWIGDINSLTGMGLNADSTGISDFGCFNNDITVGRITSTGNTAFHAAGASDTYNFQGNVVRTGQIIACQNGIILGDSTNDGCRYNTFICSPIEHQSSGYGIYDRSGGNLWFVNNLNNNLHGIGCPAGMTVASTFIVNTVDSIDAAVKSQHFVLNNGLMIGIGGVPSVGGTGDMTAEAIGSTVSAGASGKYADAGHRHAMPAAGAAGDIGAETSGTAAAAGTSGKIADAGHVHPMPTLLANPMSAAADLIVGDTGGAAIRLGKGSDGQVLTVDPTTHLLVWATPSSGFADPTTTKGDIIVHGASATTKLGVGTDGKVLTANSGATNGVDWETPTTGGLSDEGIITYLDGTVAAAPGTPGSGKLRIYAKTGKVLAVKDDTGAETTFGSGVSLGSDTPLVESGSGSAGSAATASHEDHVHPAGGGGSVPAVQSAEGLITAYNLFR
jgi:hypothetical protein